MKKTELEKIITREICEGELKEAEIPAIDLYVDQIISLVQEKQGQGTSMYSDKQLTKTMINNYSKDGVISPVKGKKYTKEQILQILSVYSLKNTLSIGEIKRVIAGAYATEGFDGERLAQLYDRYIELKEENRELAHSVIQSQIDAKSLDVENDDDFLVLLGGIVSMSAYLKNIARALIDEKYPEPQEMSDAEKKEKKEKEKEEKEEKKKKEKEEKQKQKLEENKDK